MIGLIIISTRKQAVITITGILNHNIRHLAMKKQNKYSLHYILHFGKWAPILRALVEFKLILLYE
jgi:hypothetical protein